MNTLTSVCWGKDPSHLTNSFIPTWGKKVILAQRRSFPSKSNSMKHFERLEFSDGKHTLLESSQQALFKTVLSVITHNSTQPSKRVHTFMIAHSIFRVPQIIKAAQFVIYVKTNVTKQFIFIEMVLVVQLGQPFSKLTSVTAPDIAEGFLLTNRPYVNGFP